MKLIVYICLPRLPWSPRAAFCMHPIVFDVPRVWVHPQVKGQVTIYAKNLF